MSLVALSLVTTGALWHVSRSRQFAKYRQEEDPKSNTVMDRPMSTGTYGDVSQLANLLKIPGYIIGEKIDVDINGVPCRWLRMRNGAVYKTYDMTTPYF